MVVPINMYLNSENEFLRNESDQIVNQLFNQHQNTGEYQKQLEVPHDDRIHYERRKKGFILRYHVWSKSTYHLYTNKNGWTHVRD